MRMVEIIRTEAATAVATTPTTITEAETTEATTATRGTITAAAEMAMSMRQHFHPKLYHANF
jgi:hypothetical protein